MLDDNEEFPGHDHHHHNRNNNNNDNDNRFAQQQAAVDLLFNVAQTIQPEDDASAQQREELTEHLADLTRQLELRRRMMDENNQNQQHYRIGDELGNQGSPSRSHISDDTSSSITNSSTNSDNHHHHEFFDHSVGTEYNTLSSPEAAHYESPPPQQQQHHQEENVGSSSGRNKGKAKDDHGAFFEEMDESTEEEDDDFASSSRQSLLAGWRDEHDRREDVSAKLRWRAPEFSNSPEGDIPANHFPASVREPLLNHFDQEDDEDEDEDIDNGFEDHHQDQGLHMIREQQQQDDELPNLLPFVPAPPPAPERPQRPVRGQWDNNGNENNNNNNAVDDEEPFDLGEDIDGVLEAIGMRGSMWMLLQNSVLMSLMISLCLGVAVWIPYVIGRLVILVNI